MVLLKKQGVALAFLTSYVIVMVQNNERKGVNNESLYRHWRWNCWRFYCLSSSKRKVQVILIDREDRGQATDAAAGIICPWTSQRRNKSGTLSQKEERHFIPTLLNNYKHTGIKQDINVSGQFVYIMILIN